MLDESWADYFAGLAVTCARVQGAPAGPQPVTILTGRVTDQAMLLGVLNYVVEQDDAVRIVRHLVEPLASGSHVVVGHPTGEFDPEGMQKLLELWNEANPAPMRARNRDEVTELLAGLEILEPGVVSCSRWWPNQGTLYAGRDVSQLAAVARKP